MNSFLQYTLLLTSLSVLLVLLPSCEKPQLASKEETPKETPKPKVESTLSEPAKEPKKKEVDPGKSPNTGDLKAQSIEPVISLIERGPNLTLKGGIKSRLDFQRIKETLSKKLDHEINFDEFYWGPEYIPVGWEGRVAEFLFVPFINQVQNGEIHYKEGIIRIEGRISSERELRSIQENVVDVISGYYSKDIENNLIVPE